MSRIPKIPNLPLGLISAVATGGVALAGVGLFLYNGVYSGSSS